MDDDLRQLFHSLNNQLGIILTHAELLEMKSPDEALRKKATTVLETTFEALNAVKQIRARIEEQGPETGDRGPGVPSSSP